ncbi:uncharacterized protein BP5553_10500 [Venustampulla echinocandica]|uniref:Uncharacterized protein n=1 Tax=Venustampulla echinocandica TaxID=2656787 RepID=A0A370T9I0_9HELO|nr:uncharacterized protein BP5553_10500 [Venustampulla echinocandica]RDL30222.1 hypothetical protein BP5553_10500 [Venustampulla echinocandica]
MAVLYGLPGSPGADAIPFPAAIVLSVTFFIAAVIRLGGYFLLRSHQRSHQPLQLTVSIVSLVASGLLLGFVSSRNGGSMLPNHDDYSPTAPTRPSCNSNLEYFPEYWALYM